MQAAATIVPVFLMLGLGFLMSVTGIITPEQKEGAKEVVFRILFPVLIFNIFFSSEFKKQYLVAIVYIFIVYTIAYGVGVLLKNWHGKKYADISPFMMPTVEGGNVSIPLYITIAGTSRAMNMVMFDPGGVLFSFVLVPILVARKKENAVSLKTIVITMLRNPIPIAMLSGMILNLTGVYRTLAASSAIVLYNGIVSMLTAPITGMILLVLGYDLRINLQMLRALLKLLLTRIVFFVAVIGGVYLLFSDLVKDPYFVAAIWIYFLSPTGFMIPILISDLCRDDDDRSFMSAFISLVMVITLFIYVFFAAQIR